MKFGESAEFPGRVKRAARTVKLIDGRYDGPVPNVFASTTGRAVSPRLEEGSDVFVRCRRRRGISSE